MRIYCEKCEQCIGIVLPGSSLLPGIVFLCKRCRAKLVDRSKPRTEGEKLFNDIFGVGR